MENDFLLSRNKVFCLAKYRYPSLFPSFDNYTQQQWRILVCLPALYCSWRQNTNKMIGYGRSRLFIFAPLLRTAPPSPTNIEEDGVDDK